MDVLNEQALCIYNLTVAYTAEPILLNINCSVPKGVLCGLIGPNGAGKTTLLKTVVDLIKPITGIIEILGHPFKKMRSYVAYIPQRNSVDWDFPATVFDVVMMGRYPQIGWLRWPSSADKQEVWHALALVDMTKYASKAIGILSGGQQQRVFLARALVQNADIFLMDEPFAAVDEVTECSMIALFKLLKKQGKTIIVVHHDVHTARLYFDWIILINKMVTNFGPVSTVLTGAHITTTYKQWIL